MPNYPYTFQLPPLNVQDIPNDGVAGEFLGINGSGVLDWLTAGGTGDMLKADNLSGLTSYPTARTNLGLGTGDSPTFANLTLTSPSLGSSAPVTISQTWNNAAVAFTGLKVNATSTNSAAASLLLDLQVGGVTQISVSKVGMLDLATSQASGGLNFANGYYGVMTAFNWQLRNSNGYIGIGANSTEADTRLYRDAANTLALRNGANAQTFNVYGTYTSITDYRRLSISCDNTTGNATITANKGSATTGDVGTVSINGVPVGRGKGSNAVRNISIGDNSLGLNSTGADNTAIGYYALGGNGAGSYNTSFGSQSLFSSNSNHNVALGYLAGTFKTGGVTNNPGNENVYIGSQTKALDTAQTNQIVIGYDATGIGSNSVVLGNDSITKTALKGNVGIGTTSPTSKLQVTGGDVEIETVTSGIIMKAAGTATRYRITLNAGGTALVFTAI